MARNNKKQLLKAYKTAETYRKKGQYSNAIKEYENIVKTFPHEKKTYNTLGDLYQQIKDKKNAIRSYSTYAKALEGDGFTLQAIAVYKKITRIDNEDPDTYSKLADLYNQQGIIAESISMYMHLANIYQKQGLIKRAISIYEKVIDLQPDNLKIIALLADQYLKEGMKKEAIEKYLQFADILLKNDEWDKVKNIYKKIMDLDPDNIKVRKGMGNLYFHVGDFENAEKYLIQAMQDFPDSEDILKDLGEVYIAIKDLKKARKIYSRLVSLVPNDTTQRKKYAFILLNLKEEEEAKKNIDIIVQEYKSHNNYDKIIDILSDAKKLRKYFWYSYNMLIDIYSFLKQENNKLSIMRELALRYSEKDKIIESYEVLKEIKPHFTHDKEFMAFWKDISSRARTLEEEAEDIDDFQKDDNVFDLDSMDNEGGFDIPSDLLIEDDEEKQEEKDDVVQKEIEEIDLPVDDFLEQEKEQGELIDIDMNNLVEEDAPGNTAEIIIDEEDLLEEGEDIFESEPDTRDRVEISEAELENEIDQLELSASQEIPLLMDDKDIDSNNAIIEDLDIDLTKDEGNSEYDKEMDAIFSSEPDDEFDEEAEELNYKQEDKTSDLIKENITEAEVFLKFGLTEKAFKHIKAALDMDPENIEALLKLKELYSLEGKSQDIIEVSIKLIEIYRNNEDEENESKECRFLKSIDPDNPILRDMQDEDDESVLSEENEDKDYGHLLENLMKETDVSDDFEIVQEDERYDSGVSDLITGLKKDQDNFDLEDISEDLVDAEDLFKDKVLEEDNKPVENNAEAVQDTEQEIEEEIEEFGGEDLSGEDMEIDSSVSDDFFELVSPDDGEEPYDIGEEMGIVNPEEVSDSDQSIGQMVKEFKKGVEDQLSPEDYETHYNLGIAFKEMGLIEDAIEAFEKAASTGKIQIETISMLGICYIEQGMYQQAIDYFKKGLTFLEKDSEAYIGMLYDLADVYEISNDLERAYIYFEEIAEKKDDFRDAVERYEALESRVDKNKIENIKESAKISDLEDMNKNNPRISYI